MASIGYFEVNRGDWQKRFDQWEVYSGKGILVGIELALADSGSPSALGGWLPS